MPAGFVPSKLIGWSAQRHRLARATCGRRYFFGSQPTFGVEAASKRRCASSAGGGCGPPDSGESDVLQSNMTKSRSLGSPASAPSGKAARGVGARPSKGRGCQQETLCVHSVGVGRPKPPAAEACKQSPPAPAREWGIGCQQNTRRVRPALFYPPQSPPRSKYSLSLRESR